MAIVGTILHEVVKKKKNNLEKKQLNFDLQKETLHKLLHKARNTEFGQAYRFSDILLSGDWVNCFQQAVPVYPYESLFEQYWHKLLDGKANVTWPGKVKFSDLHPVHQPFEQARTPYQDMLRSIGAIRQFLSLAEFDLPPYFYEKSILMLGGSTTLVKIEKYFEGDLSGILAGRLPFWFGSFYKPGIIARERDWNTKLNKIVKKAPDWDIGGITGVPAGCRFFWKE
jgi:hypothetical protein